MKITAQANANIALIKYWGKRNLKLNLPLNNSISLTLDKLNTTTTVEFSQKHKNDIFIFGRRLYFEKTIYKTNILSQAKQREILKSSKIIV